jgi:hypothetical protein
MARHGCGAFGNSAEKFDTSFVDRIDHLFDCIEIDQTFSFYDGKAYFSSRFYDSNIARIFRDIYDQVLSVNLRLTQTFITDRSRFSVRVGFASIF